MALFFADKKFMIDPMVNHYPLRPDLSAKDYRVFNASAYRFPYNEFDYPSISYGNDVDQIITEKDLVDMKKRNAKTPGYNGRIVRDWPLRIETDWPYHCDFCGRDFGLYMAVTKEWEKLPFLLWPHILCIDCYRTYAWMNSRAPNTFTPDINHLIRIADQWGKLQEFRTRLYFYWKDLPEVKKIMKRMEDAAKRRRR